jgi:cell division protein FtsN
VTQFTARRPFPARHELRFGRRELAIFCGAFVLIWALTFVFGILVGREIASGNGGKAAASAAAAARTPAAVDPLKRAERTATEEKLTFYKTLTAPTAEVPPTQPPRVEERIVPREPALVAERTPPRPEPVVAAADTATERPAARRSEPRAAAAPAVPAVPAAETVWTVQVSSFRSRALADELRTRLNGRGFDAYLAQATTEDGRVRWHRVRVGSFSTRAEAERVAAELRGERNVNPVVTTR